MCRKKSKSPSLNYAMLREIVTEIRWMSSYIIKYRAAVMFYVFVGILGTLMGLAGSLASKYMIDAVTQYQPQQLVTTACIFVISGLLGIGFHAVMSRMLARISLKVYQDIYEDVYLKVMEAKWEEIAEFHSGDLLNRLSGDVTTVSKSILGWIPSLLTKTVRFMGSLFILLYYDPWMAAIALCSAPVTVILSRSFLGRMRQFNQKMRAASSRITEFTEESFQNIQILKAFGLIGSFDDKLKTIQKDAMDTSMAYNEFSVKTSTLMSVVGFIVSFISMGWGIYRLWTGYITYGTMTLFLQLSRNLSSDFKALVHLVPSAVSAATSARRVMEVTELPKETIKKEDRLCKVEENEIKKGVELFLSQISFSYRSGQPILTDCSMKVGKGEFVALIGPSGSGKTTLMRIILGLVSAPKGQVGVRTISKKIVPLCASTRDCIAYVPQGNTLFSGTIEENLRMTAPDAGNDELIDALKMACAWDFVQALPGGLKFYIGEKGKGLSEGQAQRIAIARAILKKAPVILLDEATSALDEKTGVQIMAHIREKNPNSICIFATHRLSVLTMCSRVYRVENGRIIEEYESCR